MALLPTSQRDQKMLFVCIAALGLAVVYWYMFWSPANTELDAEQAHVESLRTINQTRQVGARAGQDRAAPRRDASSYAQDLEVMRELVPTANEVPVLLEQVSTAARRVGLDISDVQPLPQLNGDQYDAYKYRMSVKGTLPGDRRLPHERRHAAAHRRADQRVARADRRSIRARSRRRGRQALDARFEIQTYVARTAPAAKAGPAARLEPEPSKPGER